MLDSYDMGMTVREKENTFHSPSFIEGGSPLLPFTENSSEASVFSQFMEPLLRREQTSVSLDLLQDGKQNTSPSACSKNGHRSQRGYGSYRAAGLHGKKRHGVCE